MTTNIEEVRKKFEEVLHSFVDAQELAKKRTEPVALTMVGPDGTEVGYIVLTRELKEAILEGNHYELQTMDTNYVVKLASTIPEARVTPELATFIHDTIENAVEEATWADELESYINEATDEIIERLNNASS